jgi:hypothetical protein
MKSWSDEFRHELELARQARAQGNEGRARVCARRAGGVAAREYLRLRGDPAPTVSAYDLLKRLSTMADAPHRARQSAVFLTMRVDEEFKMPEAVDLIAEAGELCRALHPALEI